MPAHEQHPPRPRPRPPRPRALLVVLVCLVALALVPAAGLGMRQAGMQSQGAPRASRRAAEQGGPARRLRAAPSQARARPTHSKPRNVSPPTITGVAAVGSRLTATPGTWSHSPNSFRYRWMRCNASARRCKKVRGATASSYVPVAADVGSRMLVSVRAYSSSGHSRAARSAPTAVVSGEGGGTVSHLEYVLQDGVVSVYDIDDGFKLVKTISLPQTKAQVRGVMVAPAQHLMFIPFGGDGPINGSGNGSVLAYDLVNEKVIWETKLKTGIDSGAVSPDGSKLYVPTGENTESGIWNVLSAATGKLIGTIQGGNGAHNTVAAPDGSYVYLGGRNYNRLDVYETATGKVKEVGPLFSGVRPFTVNGSNTIAFTTATGLDGFQVSSITARDVLFTVSFGEVPSGFPYSAPSHGIGLSPNEQELYVIDSVHKQVQFFNVARVREGVAPTKLGAVAVPGLSGEESGCAYDCGRSGWVQVSRDGRLVFVGDSGAVIETATRKVVATLSTLAQTKVSIEVDWQNGVPIATSTRTGLGYVE